MPKTTKLWSLEWPRIEVVLTTKKRANANKGPFECKMLLHAPNHDEPQVVPLHLGKKSMMRPEAAEAMLEIYTDLGNRYAPPQHFFYPKNLGITAEGLAAVPQECPVKEYENPETVIMLELMAGWFDTKTIEGGKAYAHLLDALRKSDEPSISTAAEELLSRPAEVWGAGTSPGTGTIQ